MAPLQHYSLSHHHAHQSHAPSHHGHHPYNNVLSMPPPRSTNSGIRLPQAPPMKVPTKPGSSSPVAGTGAAPGNLNSNQSGNGPLSGSPDGLHASSTHVGSPYGTPGLASVQPLYGSSSNLRGPPGLASPDYYARRGSTSQIPQQSSQYQHDHLAMMRRGSVGATGMGMTGMSFGDGSSVAQGGPPVPNMSRWQSQQAGLTALNSAAPMPVSLSEMSVTPTPAPGGGYNSANSTPRHSYRSGDLTPSPPQQAHAAGQMPVMRGVGSGSGSPAMGTGIPLEISSLAV